MSISNSEARRPNQKCTTNRKIQEMKRRLQTLSRKMRSLQDVESKFQISNRSKKSPRPFHKNEAHWYYKDEQRSCCEAQQKRLRGFITEMRYFSRGSIIEMNEWKGKAWWLRFLETCGCRSHARKEQFIITQTNRPNNLTEHCGSDVRTQRRSCTR